MKRLILSTRFFFQTRTNSDQSTTAANQAMFYTTAAISNKVLTPETIKNLCDQ